MGGGSYSYSRSVERSTTKGYGTRSTHEVFTRRSINNAMNPYDIALRESRDSEEHPNSIAICIGLDVTGSMGYIPHFLVKEGFNHLMDKIIQAGTPDPQVLFMGIGDHECDNAPLQVGQFESSDELLDKWLTDIYLEGGGGGNKGESYFLPWHFAGNRTAIDCFEKRNQKGFLFTIGDEPCLEIIPDKDQKTIFGNGQYQNLTAQEMLRKAQELYIVKHIHIRETASGSRNDRIPSWTRLIGEENLLVAEGKEDIPDLIANTIILNLSPTKGNEVKTETKSLIQPVKDPEIIL